MSNMQIQRLKNGLNVGGLDDWQVHLVSEAYASGDGLGCVSAVHPRGMDFVLTSTFAPLDRSIYENALLAAYQRYRHNFHDWPISWLHGMFLAADRSRMRELGDHIPGAGRLVIYRGASGTGGSRKVRGMSWTTCQDTTCWYALRYGLRDPAVYRAAVSPDEVYCYTNARGEDEVIVRPDRCTRLKMPTEERRRT